MEVSGIIVACGTEVLQFKNGDAVCALIAGGGYAEFVVVREGQCLPIPKGINFTEAASLPETVFTIWSNVFERGALQPGETLLVHGGGSGIGITAIQIAKALGSNVIVTVGTEDKGQQCLALGADSFINYKTQDFEKVLSSKRIDVILDIVGGNYFSKNWNVLHTDGRLVYTNAIAQSYCSFYLSAYPYG
ncbi:MAG: zinc-binding dehydrogenase [Arachidicoccus sp.]|nr:zinc-binding dehydrogenase [Arachidicoccus sp.]